MKTLTILATALAFGSLTAYTQERAVTGDTARGVAPLFAYRTAGADTNRPADFVDVDTEPVVLVKKEPVYPALALKAGMEGKVWVKIWVDRSGSAHQVEIMKSDQEIFNQPSLEAAKQFRFTPAMIKGKPVDVWVSVPFKFRLAEKHEPGTIDTVFGGFPKEIVNFARTVLEGDVPDTANVRRYSGVHAQAIAGGYLEPLAMALKEQREGKKTIEEPGRKVVLFTGGMAEDGKTGYLVARTQKGDGDTHPHYHTIVMQQDAGRNWTIVHWHTWHGSR